MPYFAQRPVWLLALMLAVLSVVSGPSSAATISQAPELVNNEDFVRYLSSERRLMAIASIVTGRTQAAGLGCGEDDVVFPNPPVGSIQLISPVTIDPGATVPSAGRWIERVNVTHCDESRQENIFWGFNELGRIVSAGLVPGETFMSPMRQLEFNQVAIQGTALKDCDVIHIVDTKAGSAGVDVDSAAENAAIETWYFGGCGKRARRVFEFVPHLDGQLTIKTHDNSLLQ